MTNIKSKFKSHNVKFVVFSLMFMLLISSLSSCMLMARAEDSTATGNRVTVVSATPTAFVTQLNGNENDLTISIVEVLSDGTTNTFTETFRIDNNAAGMYAVGFYQVYVDTKGNTQIRECYIVSYIEDLADYGELDDLLDETVAFMEELNEADYTPESWAALLRAVEAARNVDPTLGASSQDILDALIAAINDAKANLTSSVLTGMVRGRAVDSDGTPLANMEFEVRVYVREPVQAMGVRSLSLSSLDLVGWTIYTIFTYTTDANGYYYLSLPVDEECLVQILFTGFLDFVQYIAITDTSRVLELEPVPLIRIGNGEGTGTINGILRDATNNNPISGVTIEVRPNWNNAAGTPITTITTNTNGRYDCTLSYGYYTFTASKNGYITAIMNVHIFMNSVEKNYAMNPNDGSQYRIVLTWGANPRDLDSHLVSGIGNVHCWYSNRQPSSAVRLDIDVTTGYGPETITVYNLAELGGFRYYVHHYSGAMNLWSSDAIVRVYKGVDLVRTYYVPTSSADASCLYWHVFEMDADGRITDLNVFTRDSTRPTLPEPSLTVTKANQATAAYVNNKINNLVFGTGTEADRVQRNLAAGRSAVFFFEGAGAQPADISVHQAALCVVVKNDPAGNPSIIFENEYCTTIPDYPTDKSKNGNTAMPIVIDGIYNINTVKHTTASIPQGYASLNVDNFAVRVVRFDGVTYSAGTSAGINIHHRSTDGIADYSESWVNSQGCFLVGLTTDGNSAYWDFINLIGANINTQGVDMGVVIVDRSQATEYLWSLYNQNNVAVEYIQGLRTFPP